MIKTYLNSNKPDEQRIALLSLSIGVPLDQVVAHVGGHQVIFTLLGSGDAQLQAEALRVIEATPDVASLLGDHVERWLLDKSPTSERREQPQVTP